MARVHERRPHRRLYFSDVRIAHPEYGLIAYDAGTPDQAVARAFCVPFAWDGDPALGELPVDGWDGVIWRSARDRQIGQKPNLVSALEITVPADLQGTGLSGKMLAAMRDNRTPRVRTSGRPGAAEPPAPGPGHAHRGVRGAGPRGRPAQDPWLRVHVRAGGRIVGTCKRAMVIPGTLDGENDSWDRPALRRAGAGRGARRLVPVQCSVEHDYAVYVEPAVWVHHRL